MPGGRHSGTEVLLASICPRAVEPLKDFVKLGVIPNDNPKLLKMLADPGSAVSPGDHAVVAFLEEHCPDVAYGHVAYLVRWERQGGMHGGRVLQ